MGWQINEVENTLVVPQGFAEKLYEAGANEHFFGDASEVLDSDGLLTFEPDAMEHMDYLWDEDIRKVLAEAKVNGKVVFSSSDGDNAGEWWSYTFIDGVCSERAGKLRDLIPG